MNFNSLVLEALDNVYKVIRYANDDELKKLNNRMSAQLKKPIDKAWLMDLINKTSLVAPNNTLIGGWEYIVFTPRGGFSSYTSPQSKEISKTSANSILIDKAVNLFEREQKYIKAGLTDKQAETAIRI
jgi:hypothetical protein